MPALFCSFEALRRADRGGGPVGDSGDVRLLRIGCRRSRSFGAIIASPAVLLSESRGRRIALAVEYHPSFAYRSFPAAIGAAPAGDLAFIDEAGDL